MSSIPYPNQQAIFYQQYESVRRDEVIGILLALFLGGFGIHHFYLRNTGLGVEYYFGGQADNEYWVSFER